MKYFLTISLAFFVVLNSIASSKVGFSNSLILINKNAEIVQFVFINSCFENTDSLPERDRFKIIESILNEGEKLIGLPYKTKDLAGWPLDCSGFTSYIFSLHNVKLPRSSASQSELGNKISLKEAAPGDLLFFTGRNANSGRVGHVAIVVKNEGGKITMIHSCSRGIRYDEFPKMKYYKDRFIKCVRLDMRSNLSKS